MLVPEDNYGDRIAKPLPVSPEQGEVTFSTLLWRTRFGINRLGPKRVFSDWKPFPTCLAQAIAEEKTAVIARAARIRKPILSVKAAASIDMPRPPIQRTYNLRFCLGWFVEPQADDDLADAHLPCPTIHF